MGSYSYMDFYSDKPTIIKDMVSYSVRDFDLKELTEWHNQAEKDGYSGFEFDDEAHTIVAYKPRPETDHEYQSRLQVTAKRREMVNYKRKK